MPRVVLLSDFGDTYGAATLAAAATQSAHLNGPPFRLERRILPDFDILEASKKAPGELERIVCESDSPVAAALVVDPLKDRQNLVTHWTYNGNHLYLAHPDHGQVTGLVRRVQKKAGWQLHGARIIDKSSVVPDAAIAGEPHQLWDGHAAYAPAAVKAVLRGLATVGRERPEHLRVYPDEDADYKGEFEKIPLETVPLEGLLTSSREDVPRVNGSTESIIHYIGDRDMQVDKSQIIPYGTAGSCWQDNAARVEFAAVNAYRDARVQHYVVLDAGRTDYFTYRVGNVLAVAPAGETLSLWADAEPGGTLRYARGTTPQSIIELPDQGKEMNAASELNGHFRPKKLGENRFKVAVYAPDGNGNLRLCCNSDFLEEVGWNDVSGVRAEFPDGTCYFERRTDYTPRGTDELCAILNPHATHNPSSRRGRPELFIPCGSLQETVLAPRGTEFKTGDRIPVSFYR